MYPLEELLENLLEVLEELLELLEELTELLEGKQTTRKPRPLPRKLGEQQLRYETRQYHA